MLPTVAGMLVTFLVFALVALLLLAALLWQLWPSTRVTTSVPGPAPASAALGNTPDIGDTAGGLPRYLLALHRRHGALASLWLGDFLAISLGAHNLFKLVGDAGAAQQSPYQSIVPLTLDPDILEKKDGPSSRQNSLLSSFAPFSRRWSPDLGPQVRSLCGELMAALAQLGADDQVPVVEYVTALAVKIVIETRNISNADVAQVRFQYISLLTDLDIFLDMSEDCNEDRKKNLLKKVEGFMQLVGEKDGVNVFSEILLVSVLSAWTLYHLAREDKLQCRVRGDEAAVSALVAEVARATAVVPLCARVLGRGVTVLGHTIDPGTLVLSSLSSVFWDHKLYPDPELVDIDRENCLDVLSFYPEARDSFTLATVNIIIDTFLQKFSLTLVDPDFKVGTKFSVVNKPDCDIWIKLMS